MGWALTLDELDTKLDSLKDGKIMDVSLDGVPDPDAYKDLFTINEFMTPFAPIDPLPLKKIHLGNNKYAFIGATYEDKRKLYFNNIY